MSDLNDDTSLEDVTDDTTDTDSDTEWQPPTKEEWDALVAKEHTAAGEAAKRKRWLRDLGINPKTGEKLNPDAETASQTANESHDSTQDLKRYESAGLRKGVAIYAELLKAGVNPMRVDTLLKLVDVGPLSVDDDDDLPEQISALKEEYPEFFKRERAKTTDASVVGAGKKTASSSANAQTWEDLVRERFNKGLI